VVIRGITNSKPRRLIETKKGTFHSTTLENITFYDMEKVENSKAPFRPKTWDVERTKEKRKKAELPPNPLFRC
jgi:hypothetical protein